MMRAFPKFLAAGLLAVGGLAGMPALAQAPRPWEMGMQPAFSPVKADIIALHDLVLIIITVITLFVGVLLVWVMVRYNAKANPVPSRTSHNTIIEVTWTLLPVLILVVIAIPSFRLVFYEDRTNEADLTVKATGHQWYWEYTYPDKGNLDFNSNFLSDDQLKPGQLRMLEVNNQMVVPVNKNIRVLTNSGDVIHSWFVPSLGVQRYAIPGRTIETWFRATQPGTYYGECNQICGTNHSKMPIVVHAVSEQEFDAWVEKAKTEFSDASPAVPPAQSAALTGAPALTETPAPNLQASLAAPAAVAR